MSVVASRRCIAILLAGGVLAAAAAASAETAPSYPALLAQAQGAPIPAQAAAAIDAARARRDQAGVLKNPELEVVVENFGGRGAFQGVDQAETTLSVAQTLELGGKRRARVATADAELAAAGARGAFAQADYAARLAVAYAEAEAAERRVSLADEAVAAAESDARSAGLLVDAGKEAPLRGMQARAEADRARAEAAEARASQATAFARLTALAGAEQPFDHIAISLLNVAPVAVAVAGPAGPPGTVTAAKAEQDAAAARVRAARADAISDLRVSAGVRRLEGDDATALVAGVSVPLPLFNRNRGAIAAAQADERAAVARLRQAQFDAEADRRAAMAQSLSATSRVQAAQNGEQAAVEAYRLARIGYDAGRIPLLELTAARRALAEARGRALDARLARVRAEADLARLTGRIPFGT